MFKNKMLYGLLALFVGFAMSFNSVNAQVTGEEDVRSQTQNNITGQVVDAETGEALSDVTVEVEGLNEEVTTNRYGVFTIENMDLNQGQTQSEGGMGEMGESNPDEISFTINHEGYQEFSKTLSMDEIMQLGQQSQQQAQGEDPLKFELEPEQEDDF